MHESMLRPVTGHQSTIKKVLYKIKNCIHTLYINCALATIRKNLKYIITSTKYDKLLKKIR